MSWCAGIKGVRVLLHLLLLTEISHMTNANIRLCSGAFGNIRRRCIQEGQGKVA